MKKLKLIAATLLILLFTSCNKTDTHTGIYTCTCVLTQNGTDTTLAVGEFNTSKSFAQSQCDKTKSSLVASHPTGITCTLK
jgi:hypothetical protein